MKNIDFNIKYKYYYSQGNSIVKRPVNIEFNFKIRYRVKPKDNLTFSIEDIRDFLIYENLIKSFYNLIKECLIKIINILIKLIKMFIFILLFDLIIYYFYKKDKNMWE